MLRSTIDMSGAVVSVWNEIAARYSAGATFTSRTSPVIGARTRMG